MKTHNKLQIGAAWIALVAGVTLGSPAWGAQYEWMFSSGNLAPSVGNGVMSYTDATTPGLTTFGTTDGTIVPNIAGQAASYMRVPGFTDQANGYHLTFTDSGPNGGGSYLNQYTIIFDILLPNDLNWTPFFNTNPGNANDADFYVDPSGALGIGGPGYAPAGTIAPDTWYRVAFAADLAADEVKYFVDGAEVHTGASSLDGRFSMFSNADDGVDVLLFNEGDGSGVYTHEILVSSVYFTDQTLSAAEMLALGGPNALGVVPEPGVTTLWGLALAVGGLFYTRRKKT